MTMNDASSRIVEAVDGVIGKVALGALVSLSIALGVWIFGATSDNSKQIASVATEVRDLTAAIRDHDVKLDATITSVLTTTVHEAEDIARLKQELTDHERQNDNENRRQDEDLRNLTQGAPKPRGN